MQSVSFYMSAGAVMDKLLHYLRSRGYESLTVNYSSLEIRTEKKDSFFRRNKYFFKIAGTGEEITKIEVSVNPEKQIKSTDDSNQEERICEKIYDYF
ncbi:MAG: hypothetical protein ABI855_12290 [Bacteroidota bacterium]